MKTLLLILTLLLIPISLEASPNCGNGTREGAEECDRGQSNSDSKPDSCRTNCRLPSCGDGVEDSNEQCDQGHWRNHDQISGECRTNCRKAGCGDGMVDFTLGEQCDNDSASCNDCMKCFKPKDELMINQGSEGHYAKLCEGHYTLTDKSNNGVILITGNNLVVDCTGASIHSAGSTMNQNQKPSNVKPLLRKPKKEKPQRLKNLRPLSFNLISEAHAGPYSGPTAKKGVGFVVTGSNNTLVNCRAKGFSNGIHLKGQNNVVVNSRFCGNNLDIKNQGIKNQGSNNQCKGASNWNEPTKTNTCTNPC